MKEGSKYLSLLIVSILLKIIALVLAIMPTILYSTVGPNDIFSLTNTVMATVLFVPVALILFALGDLLRILPDMEKNQRAIIKLLEKSNEPQ